MVFLGVIVSSILLFGASSGSWASDALTKCCPRSQIFSGTENSTRIDCVKSSPSTMQLYVTNVSSVGTGLPLCDDPMDVTTTTLADLRSDEYIGIPACIEILREETSDESLPIVVHCRSSQDRKENDTSSSNALLSRGIAHLRRCCPRGKLYDKTWKTCVDDVDDGDEQRLEDEFFSLLPELEDYLTVTVGPPSCDDGAVFDFEINESKIVYENQTLRITVKSLENESTEERVSLSAEGACLELMEPNSLSFTSSSPSGKRLIMRVCKNRKYCDGHPCVLKCCPGDLSYIAGVGCGKLSAANQSLEFHRILRNYTNGTDIVEDYGVLAGNPCNFDMYVVPHGDTWYLMPDGHLYVENYKVYEYEEHCLEVLRNNNVHQDGIYPFVCFKTEDQDDDISTIRYGVTTVLQVISCAFLAITLLVYICLPALQNLHGKTLMCHVASLLLAYCNLALITWVTPESVAFADLEKSTISVVCKFIGYTMLFSFMSAFSWLNVMCFDIWWTFGGMRGSTTRSRGHRRRFLLYCLYAWGLALVISFLAITVDYTGILPVYVRPNIAEYSSCWFQKHQRYFGEILFFFGPIIIQLTMNVVFFSLTAVHCNMVKAEIKRLTVNPMDPRNRRFHADKTKLIMNVKLFVVMGISWIMEVASFFVNKYGKEFQWRHELFYATDAFNCLQGLLIFILFVLKTRVYVALRKRLGLNDKKKIAASNATTAIQDPYRVKKSASSSTIMSTFAVSSSPLSS